MKHKLIFGLSLVLIICIIFGVNNKKHVKPSGFFQQISCHIG